MVDTDEMLEGSEEHARRVREELGLMLASRAKTLDYPPVTLTTATNGVIGIAVGEFDVWCSEGDAIEDLKAEYLYNRYADAIRKYAASLGLIPPEE